MSLILKASEKNRSKHSSFSVFKKNCWGNNLLGMCEKGGRTHEKIICPKSFHEIRETEAVTGGVL